MLKLYLQTFGCQMNVHDSQKIASLMYEEGYETTDDLQKADCIVINTCSIRKKPEQKVYSALGRLQAVKKKNPDLVIGVGGCVAQQEGDRLLEKIPHLDFVFGTDNVHNVPAMVKAAREKRERRCEIDFSNDSESLHYCPGPPADDVKAFVTIMQGCNNYCAYCVVPYVRGPEKSRAPGEIADEVRALVESGVREITLLGQNVNSYGKDREGYPAFHLLLEELGGIPGLLRIRFTTSHPKDLSDALIETMASCDTVCEHLHLPVQSGADPVLKRMNRGYTREAYLGIVARLKEKMPEIALSTDIITGFPGETQEDFEQTLSLLEEVRYDAIFSFKYSPRPQTSAFRMSGEIPEEVKSERLASIQSLQDGITESILAGSVGRIEEVLVEGLSPHGEGRVMGRTRTNRIVHAEGDPESLKGALVRVRIDKGLRHSLVGEITWDRGINS